MMRRQVLISMGTQTATRKLSGSTRLSETARSTSDEAAVQKH